MTTQAPFQKRALAVEILVPQGIKKFNSVMGQQEESTLSGQRIYLKNYRVNAYIECYGLLSSTEASIEIYNLPKDLMCALAGYGSNGMFNYVPANPSDISAGNGVIVVNVYSLSSDGNTSSSTLVFHGSLINGTAMMGAVPDPFVVLVCNPLNDARLIPAAPISFNGPVKASLIAKTIADSMGWGFEDSGVTTVLQNPYLKGTRAEQLEDLSEQGLFHQIVELGTLAIWPIGKYRIPSVQKIVVNANNGLLGYPAFNGVGVEFKTIYRPDLRIGYQINIETDAPNASGVYNIYEVSHHLSAELPGGPWDTAVKASFFKAPLGQAFSGGQE